jgi:hypothetical protein
MKRAVEESIISRLRKVSTPLICAAIFLFCLIYPLAFYNFDDIHAGDIGEYVNNPLHVLNGEMPYTEFWLIFPPLEVYYPALLYMIFGVKMFVLFISSWIFGALCTVMVFLLSLQLIKNKGWSLLSAMIFFFSGMISHYSGFDYGGHIYLFFLLLAAYVFLLKPNALGKYALISIGALIGIAAGFRIDLAGAFFIALVITLVYMRKKKSLDKEQLFQYLVNICLGCVVIFALIYLPFGSNIPRVIEEVLIKPPVHATNAHISIFDSIGLVAKGFSSSSGLGSAMALFRLVYDILYKLLPFVTLALFILFLRTKPFMRKKTPLMFLMLWALITLPKVIAVPDVHYLSVLNSILFLPFLALSKELIFSDEVKVKRYLKIIFAVALIIFLVAVPASRAADYLRFASEDTIAVKGSVDTLYLKDAEKAAELQAVVNYIEKNTYSGKRVGERLLIIPFFAPPLYEMTGRVNPSYYDSFIDFGFVPDKLKQEAFCDKIRELAIRHIVYGKDCQLYWNGECRAEGFEILNSCINDKFHEVEQQGDYTIYQKN